MTATPPGPDAKAELARVQAALGPRPTRRPRKATCLALTALILAGWFGLIGWSAWMEEAPVESYAPLAGADEETKLGKGWRLDLPQGWKSDGVLRFAGPDGSALVVRHGTIGLLEMGPRPMQGSASAEVYTATAYATGLRKRLVVEEDPLLARRFTLGPLSGVEAWLSPVGKPAIRAFAVVDAQSNVVELAFSVPAGAEAPAWGEAEALFRSLRRSIETQPAEVRPPASPAAEP